ncbi:hypothetical protein [Pontibacter lucknowensis]|uniref:Uncharacterized protein n=1 Tax=Pontibacter lucknowensis TaxID=1077936 RepID=A0A1N6Y1C9_9BACT|nr:hypothetical protein [Pontibacter lucknowensis]SIR08378.1 hypothetical protein SAMN05421545_2200 [Pontibacter lucknowensis]
MSIIKTLGSIIYRLHQYLDAATFRETKRGATWSISSCIEILQVWLLLSCLLYYAVNTTEELVPSQLQVPIFSAVIFTLTLVNYVLLEQRWPWGKLFKIFLASSAPKNNPASALGWLLALLVVVNVLFSYFLLSNIDWAHYR